MVRVRRPSAPFHLQLLIGAIWAAAILGRAWLFMLTVGICHAELGLPPRTCGLWIALLIATLLSICFVNVRTHTD